MKYYFYLLLFIYLINFTLEREGWIKAYQERSGASRADHCTITTKPAQDKTNQHSQQKDNHLFANYVFVPIVTFATSIVVFSCMDTCNFKHQ